MTSRFASNESLWREIQTRVSKGKEVRAAVAYFDARGMKLIQLRHNLVGE